MMLRIDTESGVPPYEQIRQQVRIMVAHGTLAEGDRLPTIAQLANDLGIARGTVARAYRELEDEQLVRSSRRAGTFITGPGVRTGSKARKREVDAAVAEFVLRVRQLGVDPDKALGLAREMLDREA